ncbi:hypothetical protein [Kitasatospora sp. NPDC001683]
MVDQQDRGGQALRAGGPGIGEQVERRPVGHRALQASGVGPA